MSHLYRRAQQRHLAEILRTTEDWVEEITVDLTSDDLAALLSAVSDTVFERLAPLFTRAGKLAPLMPDSLVASVAQRVVPPPIAGRAGGALGLEYPDRVSTVLRKFPPEYLAEAAPFVDPRVVPHFAPIIDQEVLVSAAGTLLARRHYRIGALFVEHADLALMPKLVAAVPDTVGIVNALALVSDPERLADILRSVPDADRRAIIQSAADNAEGVVSALSVLSRVDARLADPLIAALVRAGGDDLYARAEAAGVADDLARLAFRAETDPVAHGGTSIA